MGDFPFMEFLAREYHGKANGTGNWWDYVKAHGLANACLAKDKDSIDRAEFLYQIEVDWYKGNHPLSFSEHRDLVSHHKAQLQEFRKATQINFESLKEEEVKLDMLDIFSEANLNQAYNFATSVFGKSQHCAEGFIIFSKQVMKSSVDVLAKIDMFPPCDFAVLGLGSVPSGVVTPYSDIEYVILIETDKNLDYFWKLAVESYFQINNLGESPLSIFKLKELAEATFSKPAVTGYRIDGFGSRAGNIPTGKPFGLHKIQTVEGMMELYKNGLKALLGDYTGDVADLLANSTLIYSTYNGERLYKAFSFERMTYEQNTVACNKHVAEKRLRSFSADMEKYSFMPVAKNFGSPQNFDITTKTDIFRFITLLALSLSTALGLDSKYVWKIFDNLLDKGLSKENHRYLQIVLGLSLYTRTVAYLELGTKSEHLSLYTYNQSAAHKKKHYHMPTNIFVILGCLLVPIKECTNHSVRKLILSALDPETNSFVAGFNINKALQEFLNGFQIVKSDFLQRLYFAVGHDNVDSSCHKFLKIIRDKYESQQIAFSHDDKSLAEMVCFIMMSEKKYSVTLSYLSWLIDNENSCQLCRIRYKILRSQCLNCCFAYADAYKTLIDAFQDLRLHLNVSSENTFYSHLKMLATTTECKDEKEALLFEVLTHAYSTLAATSRHLKFFMLANECIRLSKMISKPVLNKIRKNRRFQVSLTDLLGVIHSEKGEYNKALDFHQESLKQLQEMHGKSTNHRHIAIVYSNMGKVYRLKGDYKRSLEFYDKALKMRMEVFSGLRVHPDIGECYTDIGAVLLDNGNFNAALDSHRKSVEIAEKSNSQYLLAKAHYNLSHVYQKLGWHLKSLDELHKALYQVKSCIAFTSETFHPDIAECYSEMANVYTLLGDYQLSFDYRKQAEDMIKAIHQVADPYTSPTFNDLVNINHQKEKLIHKIHSSNMELDAYIVRHGENSNCPDMAKGFTNMGNLYQYLGDFSKAHTYFSKSLMIWKNISGSDSNNPHIASCYEDLGDVYSSKCDYSQSLDNYSKALEMRVCVYEGQADHPEIAASYSKMGKVKMKIGKYSESLRFHQEALNMRKRVFGQSMIHPDVAESYHNIGVLYNEMGLYTESLEYHNKSVNMMKAVYCDTGSHEKLPEASSTYVMCTFGKEN
ncbi:hypothetical protein EB796_018089 [Bugula neritina]|uniref:Protein-PII uridylyltransferase N-terminal domain-containing protein n=1 Tax=Bugula neritina TaxID=10212 RepID=A0A7J7JBZ8_BUGNE|nr:hypothetical protein EB796_018089 [Bugula neritina]